VCSYLDMDGNWDVFRVSVEARLFMSREIVERLVTGAGFDIAPPVSSG